MRMRKNPNLTKILKQHPHTIITNPQQHKGNWNKHFQNNNPIEIELGMGKGTFITTKAQQNPNINYIGIDLLAECTAKALNKIIENQQPTTNIRLITLNLQHISEIFAPQEIHTIYLNFSDPWPKAKHSKRRLTHPNYLNQYKTILKENHNIILKTDNRPLFDYTIEQLQQNNYQLTEICYDLASLNDPTNIKTEYEEKFTNLGQPIHRLQAKNTK